MSYKIEVFPERRLRASDSLLFLRLLDTVMIPHKAYRATFCIQP